MKARIPAKHRLTTAQQGAVEEYVHKQIDEIVRKNLKLVAYALNREFGFGRGRILRVIRVAGNLADEHETDPIFWDHLDRVVIDELKIPFKRGEDE